MKKLIATLLALVMICSLVGCGTTGSGNNTTAATTQATTEATTADDGIMSYDKYIAAELDSEVTVTCYVQATQGWWFNDEVGHGVITVYAHDKDGAYYLYEMECAEEDASKLVPGTQIEVTGVKGEWSGEIEIIDATFKFVENGDTFVAEPVDVTAFLGTDEMIKYQNQFAVFTDMEVKSISYKNEQVGNDIYVKLTRDGTEYTFCVESYLTGPDTDVYKAVGELKEGDVIDVEGFVYWYEGMNPHITKITKQ